MTPPIWLDGEDDPVDCEAPLSAAERVAVLLLVVLLVAAVLAGAGALP